MKNLELQQALQKLPPNAEVEVQTPGGMFPIEGLQLKLPATIPLDKPGLGWADAISESLTGVLVTGTRIQGKEAKSGGQ